MIILLVVFAALSWIVPGVHEGVSKTEIPEPEPAPIVEHVDDAMTPSVIEGVAGWCIIAGNGAIAWKLANGKKKRRDTIVTDKTQYVALLRKLDNMTTILEAATEKK